jgi:hypothetical protein
MADFRVSNLTVRVEDNSLPKGTIHGQARFIGDEPKVEGADGGGCGCSCTCSCSCTCTCTSTSGAAMQEFSEVDLAVLRESLKGALAEVEEIERTLGK